jgi:hypothetical protein
MTAILAFAYLTVPHVRRHGPNGYESYSRYRPWLRDEFCFRCVYCLRREVWGRLLGAFHIDHFVPQSRSPALTCEYINLLYLCQACNALKSDLILPDPSAVALADLVNVGEDGAIQALTKEGEILIEQLRLDDEDTTRSRSLILETLKVLMEKPDKQVFKMWMGFPNDLPNLARLTPPENRLPDGVLNSWWAKRERGELPETY